MTSTSGSSPKPSPGSEQRTATLQLGALTGAWRQVYAVRAALHATAAATVLTAWRRDLRVVPVGDLVRRFRQAAGIGEDHLDAEQRQHAAAALALAMLMAQPWTRTRAALRVAVQRAGDAGRAAVVQLADDSDAGEDEDGAEDDGDAGADDAPTPSLPTGTALGPILAATARRVARALAGSDSSHTMQTAAVRAALAAGADLLTAVDLLVSGAYTSALVSSWRQRGAQRLDYITAGDGRVCPACESAEDGSPYSADAVPRPPLHPNCRCIVQPTT